MEEPFGRYLDADGVCYRTFPGTHPSKGTLFTRGTSKDEYACYTESGAAYVSGVNRLARKWETAKSLVPPSRPLQNKNQSDTGMIFFGTSTYANEEALDRLAQKGKRVDALQVRAFPFDQVLEDFVISHKRIFVIEQNRDAQFRSLIINELDISPEKLISLLNYDGMPITAARIIEGVMGKEEFIKA